MDLQKALKEAYMSGVAEAQIGDQIKDVAFDYEGMANAYAETKVENLGLFNVTNRSEVLGKFYIHLSELAIIEDTCRNDKEMEEAINKFK